MLILCPRCREKLDVPETSIGKHVRCPSCKCEFLPQADPVEDHAIRPCFAEWFSFVMGVLQLIVGIVFAVYIGGAKNDLVAGLMIFIATLTSTVLLFAISSALRHLRHIRMNTARNE